MDGFEKLKRMMRLAEMDNDLRNRLGDEDIFEEWLIYGVPDGTMEYCDWNMLDSMVTDEASYKEVTDLYFELMEQAEVEPAVARLTEVQFTAQDVLNFIK